MQYKFNRLLDCSCAFCYYYSTIFKRWLAANDSPSSASSPSANESSSLFRNRPFGIDDFAKHFARRYRCSTTPPLSSSISSISPYFHITSSVRFCTVMVTRAHFDRMSFAKEERIDLSRKLNSSNCPTRGGQVD